MDPLLIALRVIHVGSGMAWFGGAVLGVAFLTPTMRAIGRPGQVFMAHATGRQGMGRYFVVVVTLTILSGLALYWRDSGGLQLAWVTTPTGFGFTIGAVAGIGAFILGGALAAPGLAEQAAVNEELAASDAPATPSQASRLADAERKIRLAGRTEFPLLLLAALMMAISRYL